jgi:hypothetical protein|tara:strand:- start:1282 stop:1956 length:675 start_codon:yes stop_codon:yes gene_type:complete
MLSTNGMSAGSGKEKPVIEPGNQLVKINSVTFDQTPYDADAYNITLNVESEPMNAEFQGFLLDQNNPNGPRYAGQVGRVRFSPYAYKDTTLPNGNEISRDTEVMKAMIFLSEVLGKRTELDQIKSNTIEEFMVACNVLFSNSEFVNMCLGSREWENKDGYVNNDLYLPKLTKAGVPIEAVGVEPSRLVIYNSNDTNHLRRVIKKVSPTTNNFEPAKTTGDDFDL